MIPYRLVPIVLLAGLLALSPAARGEAWVAAPLFGGEVHSLAHHPMDPEVVFAGTAAGQVYRSSDGGVTWEAPGLLVPLPGWVVAVLHFDRNQPDRLWAGLRGVWGGTAVVYSDDRGESWEMAWRRPEDTLFSFTTVPGAPGRLIAGTRSGVWGSDDGGDSWRHLSTGHGEIVEVSSILVHPELPRTVIAGTYRRAFRSDDGGETWRGIFDGMVLDTQLSSLQPVLGKPGDMWASTCGWTYHWSEEASRWVRSREGLAERRGQTLRVLPGGRLLVGTVAGVYLSDDGGRSWQPRGRADLSILSLAHHPRRPEVVLAGTEGSGVWRSTDGGATFTPSYHGLAAPRVSALTLAGERLLAAVAHGGPSSGLYMGTDGGRRVVQLQSGLPNVRSLTADGGQVYAATEQGLYRHRLGVWERVPELEEQRIDQVLMAEGRTLVLTPSSLLEMGRGGPKPVPVGSLGRPLSVVFHAGAWWVSGTEGVVVLEPGGHRAVAVPTAGGQLSSLGSRLLLAGDRGAWSRDGAGSPWQQHGAERSRLVPTGDRGYPVVLVTGETAELFDAARGELVPLRLPYSARSILAAAVWEGRLFLGTSGLGLTHAELAALLPPLVGHTGTLAAPAPQE